MGLSWRLTLFISCLKMQVASVFGLNRCGLYIYICMIVDAAYATVVLVIVYMEFINPIPPDRYMTI